LRTKTVQLRRFCRWFYDFLVLYFHWLFEVLQLLINTMQNRGFRIVTVVQTPLLLPQIIPRLAPPCVYSLFLDVLHRSWISEFNFPRGA
jgi:hypothetical protein